jgi:hypothetical protein
MRFNRFNIGRLQLAALSLAAFPVSPLIADEPPRAIAFERQAVATADAQTSARDRKADLRAKKTPSILALLDVPEGESGAFYRERLQDL